MSLLDALKGVPLSARLKEQVALTDKQIADAAAKVAELKRQLGDVRAERDDLTVKLDNALAENRELATRLKAVLGNQVALERDVAELEQLVAECRRKIEAFEDFVRRAGPPDALSAD